MHSSFDEAFTRWDRRLLAASKAAAADPAERRPWLELAEAARAIEADSVLEGAFQLAYLATKLDAAVTELLGQSLPPSVERLHEVHELVMAFDAPRVDWERRRAPAASTGEGGTP